MVEDTTLTPEQIEQLDEAFSNLKENRNEDEFLEKFKSLLEREGKQTVTTKELRATFSRLPESNCKGSITNMRRKYERWMEIVDQDKSGVVNINEFIEMMRESLMEE